MMSRFRTASLAIYDGAIVVDHLLGKVHLASPGLFGDPEKWVAEAEKVIMAAEGVQFPVQTLELAGDARPRLTANMTKAYYLDAIARIKEYIRSGDIYQVNMTQRFQCRTEASPYDLYTRLRNINPAPFAAYIDFGMGQLLSSSPERFLQIRNGKVQTRPIKGTRPRGTTEQEDSANRQELLESEKDRAELLMIVDLMRNDLGRVCKTGSVKVTEMYHIEDYSTVFQLVSTVEGELEEGIHALDCIKAAFPGRIDNGRTENQGDGNHRRNRADPAQRLYRINRVCRLQRRCRSEHRHPDDPAERRHGLFSGRRRNRLGFGCGNGI